MWRLDEMGERRTEGGGEGEGMILYRVGGFCYMGLS